MGVILFIVACTAVAIRLLYVCATKRHLPELFLGLGYLLAGALGWGVLMVGMTVVPDGTVVSESYQAASVVAMNAGAFCFYLFVWHVFRRDSLVAKGTLAVVALILVASLVLDTFVAGETFGPPPGSPTTLGSAVVRTLAFAWMAAEAFRNYGQFRRRARIGLGNPTVANRLLLWGISATAMLALSAVALGLYVTAVDAAASTMRQRQAELLYGTLGIVSALALWFAFFPPRAYAAWIAPAPEEKSDG